MGTTVGAMDAFVVDDLSAVGNPELFSGAVTVLAVLALLALLAAPVPSTPHPASARATNDDTTVLRN